jgi:hypothetical protein
MRALPLLPLFLAGCVSVTWTRESRYDPVPGEAVAKLSAGESDLGTCLEALGAPLWVWEHPFNGGDGRDGAALAYGWFDERDLGLSFSVPVSKEVSASFDFDKIDARMRGLVLFFDGDWKLTAWRSGLLRDLTREARRPPVYHEEDA